MMMMTMMMDCFGGMVGLRTARSHISEGTIVKKHHHGDFPACRSWNRTRIAEAAAQSATVTRRHHLKEKILKIKGSCQSIYFPVRPFAYIINVGIKI